MKSILIIIFFFSIFAIQEAQSNMNWDLNNSLNAFVTDGCTMFIDGPPRKPKLWKHCCLEHDVRYWFGGDQSDMDKADLRLKECINDVAGTAWAELIYTGVRLGHYSPAKNKTHWSWGWTSNRPKIPLESSEKIYIIEEIRRLPFDIDFLETFIKRNFNNYYVEI